MLLAILLVIFTSLPFLWWYLVLKKYNVIKVPGPPPLPIFGNALDVGRTPQQFFNNFLQLAREYGGLFKIYIASDVRILISDPDVAELLLNSNTHISKTDAYDRLGPWLGSGLLTGTGAKWKSRRKMITPTFHFKILEEFLMVFNSCGNILVSKLLKDVGKESIDIYTYVALYALDVVCETSMGVKVSVQMGQNSRYVESVRQYLDIFMERTFSTWQRFDLLFKFSQNYRPNQESLKIMHNFTNGVIRRRRKEKLEKVQVKAGASDDGVKRKIALLDMLLENEEAHSLTNEDIREEIDTFMFAGHDTTASAIAFAILCLGENPEIQEQVYEEIVSIVGTDKNANVTMQQIQDMKYLEMVIKEALRIYPSVPVYERKLYSDCTLGKYTFPKGTFLSVFAYRIHHSEEYFPNPEKFDPYRFLPENQAKRHNYAYLPFSAGPRNCIGQKFAMLSLKTVIIKILQNFRILQVPNFTPELGMAAVLKSYNGVCVKLQRRRSD